MNNWIALVISFNAESFTAVSMCLHLLSKKDLKFENPRFYRLNYLVVIRPVVGQEVDQPHGARFADVQIL